MRKNQKEALAVFISLAVIVAIVLFVLNLDRVFPTPEQVFEAPTAPIASTVSGKITVTEFSDFECPFCAQTSSTLMQLKLLYGERIEVVYKHFPLHANSHKAAEAAECARNQNKFWGYHDILFENQKQLDVQSLQTFATEIGLDQLAFEHCLTSGAKSSVVSSDYQEAIRLGIRGTPTFFVADKVLEGAHPITDFKEVIDDELESLS